MSTLLEVIVVVQAVITGAVVALHVIAPFTKTNKDDTVLSWLQWIEAALRRVLPTPSPAVARLESERIK